MTVSDQEWQAISTNDKTYDDVFWYAVKSTKIFCRPSCPSRLPKRDNVDVYYLKEAPLKDGFRPCKRCQPLNETVSNQVWVKEIDTILETHYSEPLSLRELSYLAHGSESYLRHVYKAETGVTPQQRLMSIRLKKAADMLSHTNRKIAEIAESVGIPNVSYFVQQFKAVYHDTPKKFRESQGR
ncbi:bifunctional transcriptional activator/DNA repair enzyme AdaA [Vagococcus silagei]|uniref:Methylphosphotriester-DNA--protein-cysteine methyltransferase family protein n=1 Tax=Vagococcus silagei TaxID=2508885 RepID=A0A4S3B5J3_9ENTE|nr:Ada metal-binding domain-containing protein [Vagococcus silagei]THB61140.1 methylphosphotriester-DNA--protein-cysteine methyltransferase family protein [Vagococcus silagei]